MQNRGAEGVPLLKSAQMKNTCQTTSLAKNPTEKSTLRARFL